jgi:hypothetical protein
MGSPFFFFSINSGIVIFLRVAGSAMAASWDELF